MRERAVALVLEGQSGYGWQWEAMVSVAGKVGVSTESLRRWGVKRDPFIPQQDDAPSLIFTPQKRCTHKTPVTAMVKETAMKASAQRSRERWRVSAPVRAVATRVAAIAAAAVLAATRSP